MVLAWTDDELSRGQAQNGINFDFESKFDLEVKGQSPPKTTGSLTKVSNGSRVIARTSKWLTRGRTDRRRQRQYPMAIQASGKIWNAFPCNPSVVITRQCDSSLPPFSLIQIEMWRWSRWYGFTARHFHLFVPVESILITLGSLYTNRSKIVPLEATVHAHRETGNVSMTYTLYWSNIVTPFHFSLPLGNTIQFITKITHGATHKLVNSCTEIGFSNHKRKSKYLWCQVLPVGHSENSGHSCT